MIKIFRKIRHKLIGSNRFSKYLLYASGEIVLVMIGILLALQVNNWSEKQQKNREEKTILMEIANNLKVDIGDFNRNLIHFINTQNAAKSLLDAIESNAENHDSLAFHLYYVGVYPHFSPNVSGYKLLQSKGLELISNDSLRQTITNIYENSYPYIQTWERERIDYNLAHINTLRNKYLGIKSVSGDRKPPTLTENGFLDRFIASGGIRHLKNYDDLKMDTELKSAIKDAQVYAKLLHEFHLFVQNQVIELAGQIESEVN